MNRFFPTRRVRKKDIYLPWFNEVVKKKIRKKKAVYKDKGRSPRLLAIEAELDRFLARRREKFLGNQRENISSPEATKTLFRNIKAYQNAEMLKTFDVRELRPELSDKEMAEEIAIFFNKISKEFDPIDLFDIPRTYDRQLPLIISAPEPELKLKTCKKKTRW